ncbi:MAG TPA: AAA family ATPase [Pilimelia sp.]|nr:AAA family ATPase [Pilimelia sp.]
MGRIGGDPDPELLGSPLVGRSGELRALEDALARLRRPAPVPQVLQIEGDPGMGKTRLLDELIRLSRARDIDARVGHATEYERHVPFGLFTGVFGDCATDGLDDGARAALGVVLSAPGAAARAGATGAERYRLHRTLRGLLSGLVRPSGAVLTFDDVQWADDASADLLGQLLRAPLQPRLLTAIAHRTGQLPPKLARALAQTRCRATRLSLAPLHPADVDLLYPDETPQRRARLYQLSGGNPLYLEMLARADDAALTALTPAAPAEPAPLPSSLRCLLSMELDALDETHATVARVIAVVGDPIHLDMLVHVMQRPEAEVARAVDDLVARDVVRCAASRFSLRHPLLRAAAYQAAGPAWRIHVHRRVEDYLRLRGAPVTVRAHHAAAVASFGDLDAAETLVAAATEALGTAPAAAAHWLRLALTCLPEHEETAEHRAGLLLMLARALNLSGGLVESREIIHQVLGLSAAHHDEAVRYRVVTERLLGRLDESKAALQREVASRSAERDESVGPLLVELAGAHLLGNELAECARVARAAVEDGRRRRDRGQQAAGATLAAVAALHGGDAGEARRQLAHAVPTVDGLTDTELREHLHLLPPLAWAELHLGRYAEAQRHVRRAADIARGSGRTTVLPYVFIVDAACAVRQGRVDRALRHADDATEVSLLIGSPETLAMARATALPAVLWKHGPVTALEHAELLVTDGLPASRWWAELAVTAIAAVHLEAGRWQACVDLLQERADAPAGGVTALHTARASGLLAVARAHQGAAAQARQLAAAAVRAARALDSPWHLGLAHLAHARVLAALDEPTEAAAEADAAVRELTKAGAPLDAAVARYVESRARAATGDLPQARRLLGRAKSACQASAAAWLSSEIARAEVRLGAQAPRPGAGPGGAVGTLSERELEVARLVATGLTNKEIARRLHLSPKTVEAHLAKVFAKLDVRSRVEVARVLGAAR